MNDQEKLDLVALSLCKGFGRSRIQQVIDLGIQPSEIIADPNAFQSTLSLAHTTREALSAKTFQALLDKITTWLDQPPHHIVVYGEPDYPHSLENIANPPMILYAIGDIGLLKQPQIAIVGTRKFTQYGKTCSEYFSQGLAQAGFVITSGLAEGIDTLAHHGTLSANGKTIAVVGTGLDIVYPARNRSLAQQIVAQGGLIISEFPLGTAPERHNFPMRNRIISGLSLGTLVIECAEKSGSLITAQLALEQNREVFAVPGNIFHDNSVGCHSLIRQGAKITSCIQDILDEINTLPIQDDLFDRIDRVENNKPTTSIKIDCPNLKKIYETISDKQSTLDELMANTAFDYATLTTGLFELEMLGCIEAVVGGYRKV